VEARLANPETPIIPDISTVPINQQELLQQALAEQDKIGWKLGVRGYLSRHWGEAVTAHSQFEMEKQSKIPDIGNTWTCKTPAGASYPRNGTPTACVAVAVRDRGARADGGGRNCTFLHVMDGAMCCVLQNERATTSEEDAVMERKTVSLCCFAGCYYSFMARS